jgi:hypothetical protein
MMALTDANDAGIGFYLHQQAWPETDPGAHAFNVRDFYFPGIG